MQRQYVSASRDFTFHHVIMINDEFLFYVFIVNINRSKPKL